MERKKKAETLGIGMMSGTPEPPAHPGDEGTASRPHVLPSLLHLLGTAVTPGWPHGFGRALVAP